VLERVEELRAIKKDGIGAFDPSDGTIKALCPASDPRKRKIPKVIKLPAAACNN
jgi:hypothetical protein